MTNQISRKIHVAQRRRLKNSSHSNYLRTSADNADVKNIEDNKPEWWEVEAMVSRVDFKRHQDGETQERKITEESYDK